MDTFITKHPWLANALVWLVLLFCVSGLMGSCRSALRGAEPKAAAPKGSSSENPMEVDIVKLFQELKGADGYRKQEIRERLRDQWFTFIARVDDVELANLDDGVFNRMHYVVRPIDNPKSSFPFLNIYFSKETFKRIALGSHVRLTCKFSIRNVGDSAIASEDDKDNKIEVVKDAKKPALPVADE
jgi:hypothetical protein